MLVLLLKTKRFLVSDDRDRVFALLGIVNHKVATHQDEYLEGLPDGRVANDIEPEFFSIDYSKSTSEVYRDTTKYLIKNFQSFLPLYVRPSLLSDDDLLKKPPFTDLPTWAPDCPNVQVPQSETDTFDERSEWLC